MAGKKPTAPGPSRRPPVSNPAAMSGQAFAQDNSVTLAQWAYGSGVEQALNKPPGHEDRANIPPPSPPEGRGHTPALSPHKARTFEVANQHYQQSHLSHAHAAAVQPQGEAGHHGWTPDAAAARARGAQTLYSVDPTQAPDYVAQGKDR